LETARCRCSVESTRTSSGTPEQCQCLRSRWRTLWQVRQGPFISGDRSIAHLRGASELKPRPMTAKRPIPACCHPGCQRHLLCSLAAHFCSAGNDTMSSQAQRSSPLGCDLHLHSCRFPVAPFCGCFTACWRPHWYLNDRSEACMMTGCAPSSLHMIHMTLVNTNSSLPGVTPHPTMHLVKKGRSL
jgi:hypothetical protein